jgi:hypothetical protein
MSHQTTTELSSRSKENLQRNAELRRRDSKFIKMQSEEKRIFQFNPEKIEQVQLNLMERRLLNSDTR